MQWIVPQNGNQITSFHFSRLKYANMPMKEPCSGSISLKMAIYCTIVVSRDIAELFRRINSNEVGSDQFVTQTRSDKHANMHTTSYIFLLQTSLNYILNISDTECCDAVMLLIIKIGFTHIILNSFVPVYGKRPDVANNGKCDVGN